MRLKHGLFAVALVMLLSCGIYTAVLMGNSAPTYESVGVDPVALMNNPTVYDNSKADGVAAVIVNENLARTVSRNVVFSVVYNFRGYDTMGESFILIAAIAGSMAILRKPVRGKLSGKGE